jgi:hypothetical protein
MVKKRLELSIEKPILKKAKKQIPNLSNFVEEILRAFFDCDDIEGAMLRHKKQKYEDKIAENRVQIAIIDESLRSRIQKEENTTEIQNNKWTFLFGNYKNTGIINQKIFDECVEILNMKKEDLMDILDFYKENIRFFDVVKIQSSWKDALKEYHENKG